MSFDLKRRIVIGMLGLVATWPAAHHALARRYHFDPWKFFGWAMYAAPVPRIEVRFAERIGNESRAIGLTPELRAAAADWAARRALWGEWLAPDDLVRMLSGARGGMHRITIQVRLDVLDRDTAMVRAKYRLYEYKVAGDGSERSR